MPYDMPVDKLARGFSMGFGIGERIQEMRARREEEQRRKDDALEVALGDIHYDPVKWRQMTPEQRAQNTANLNQVRTRKYQGQLPPLTVDGSQFDEQIHGKIEQITDYALKNGLDAATVFDNTWPDIEDEFGTDIVYGATKRRQQIESLAPIMAGVGMAAASPEPDEKPKSADSTPKEDTATLETAPVLGNAPLLKSEAGMSNPRDYWRDIVSRYVPPKKSRVLLLQEAQKSYDDIVGGNYNDRTGAPLYEADAYIAMQDRRLKQTYDTFTAMNDPLVMNPDGTQKTYEQYKESIRPLVAKEPLLPPEKPLTPDQVADNARLEMASKVTQFNTLKNSLDENIAAGNTPEETADDRFVIYNLHRQIAGQPTVSREEFDKIPPKQAYFHKPTTVNQDRSFEATMKRIEETAQHNNETLSLAMQRLGISQAQLGISQASLELRQQQFETKGGGTSHKESEKLTKGEMANAIKVGVTNTAQRKAPVRVRRLLNDPKYWTSGTKMVKGKDDKMIPQKVPKTLSPAGIKYRDEINQTELDAEKNRNKPGTVIPSKGGKVTYQGKIFTVDQCKSFAAHVSGVPTSKIRSLPRIDKSDIQDGDILHFSNTPHWGVARDGNVLELQSTTGKGKHRLLGVHHDRSIMSLSGRIVGVYRPRGKSENTVSAKPKKKKTASEKLLADLGGG